MNNNIFNVRVYGILINEKNELLVTDEYILETFITKFPGGGLQFGEGTIDCLKREMMEELNIEVEVVNHFYTTDFFQPSFFNEQQQVVSIYYLIKPLNKSFSFAVKEKRFDFDGLADGAQIFRWIKLSELREDDFTFPIDKRVGEMLVRNSSKP